jgi:UDP-N-acetylmuramate--alanine ligase
VSKQDNFRLRVGIFFGGSSREREVSFAGGRTVYDNLDKTIFDAVPIFIDEEGQMIILHWSFVYRGTIRDFYPPVTFLPESPNHFQVYSESLKLSHQERVKMGNEIGQVIHPDELKNHIDFAFLALHGEKGEDGNIQGLLEFYNVPYSGSGILPSAVGMNKAVQKKWMLRAGFDNPNYLEFSYNHWKQDPEKLYADVCALVGYPLVVKSANQGSSIGISILEKENKAEFFKAVDKSFFRLTLTKKQWLEVNQVEWIRELSDIRSSLGFPLFVNEVICNHPEQALTLINEQFTNTDLLQLEAIRGEVDVVVESCIEGREFSCIVILDEDGSPRALPPTEIVKMQTLFDYKSKYLPGLSRKVTPIDLPTKEIQRIRTKCTELFAHFNFNVYARIDGFYTNEGQIFLNDPNTTSGMMPSSFFFHQAAEIGLNPSQFLTYLIHTSIQERIRTVPSLVTSKKLLSRLETSIKESRNNEGDKIRVAVIMGGYSTERHISVESGRNIYEKLASSGKYAPFPVFLTGGQEAHQLYLLPINMMLKDNADDIKQKVEDYHRHPIIDAIIEECSTIASTYGSKTIRLIPQLVDYEGLAKLCDEVFIALHGRPGEDGEIQKKLEAIGLPYNGSGVQSSATTINKFETNSILRLAGFKVADGVLVTRQLFEQNPDKFWSEVESMGYPFIAKPADEGCSSAVKKIKSKAVLEAYAQTTFRAEPRIGVLLAAKLGLEASEEFPAKDYFLLEKFIDQRNAKHFIEITGGMLTRYEGDQLVYEIFEPSEALAEGEVLTLAEKFLAGEGQNITPARFDPNPKTNASISAKVREVFQGVARTLNVEGYCRIDAFVRIFDAENIEVIIIEINSLPGMTPATCIYHQAAINAYKPFDFIDKILTFGRDRESMKLH